MVLLLVFSSFLVRVFGLPFFFGSSFLLTSPFSLLLEDYLASELLSLYSSRFYSLAFDILLRCNPHRMGAYARYRIELHYVIYAV